MEASSINHLSKLLFVALFLVAISVTAKTDDGTICGVSQSELMECKPAVARGAADPPLPTAACCSSLKHADLPCFCTFKTNKYLPLFGINATRAMQLPSKCDPTQIAPCA